MKINKNNKKYPSKSGTNLLEIQTADKNNLSKIIGSWLAIQLKEVRMKN